MSSALDERLKKAQKSDVNFHYISRAMGLVVVLGFLFWLLLVKGFVILTGPEAAVSTSKVTLVEGSGYVSGNKVYLIGTDAKIVVSADRFEPETVAISANTSSNIEVVLKPSPATLFASVNVADGDTSWYVEGVLNSVGQQLESSLAPGEYEILVDNPYYAPFVTSVVLERGLEQELDVTLEPIEGVITLNSEPAGANVFVDDELYGQTPLQLDAEGGAYNFRLELQGYEAVTDTVELTNLNKIPTREYQLAPEKGMLTINAEPESGLLTINGSTEVLGQVLVESGREHLIQYAVPGFYSMSRTIELQPGEHKSISFALQPEIGEVILEASHPAMVLADGQPIGTTPLTIEAQALPIKFDFVADGFRTVQKTVTPKGKQTLTVNADMLTEFEARRQGGLPLFVSGLGIDMVKFRGTAFTMGSAPGEQGRSRNEYPLKVTFSKQFWVSRHEITEAQYRAYDSGRDNTSLPITDVTWLDAAMYCNWLSENEGLTHFYQIENGRLSGIDAASKGYRLPTEAEWEWLAKKAKRAKETTYVWGNTERIPNEIGNFGDQSIQGSQALILKGYNDGFVGKAPVGSYKQERAGLFDLAGNVSEWVHDLYTNTPPNTAITHKDYLGPTRGLQNVVKGAHFKSGRLKELRAAKRDFSEESADTIGFRIARYE